MSKKIIIFNHIFIDLIFEIYKWQAEIRILQKLNLKPLISASFSIISWYRHKAKIMLEIDFYGLTSCITISIKLFVKKINRQLITTSKTPLFWIIEINNIHIVFDTWTPTLPLYLIEIYISPLLLFWCVELSI